MVNYIRNLHYVDIYPIIPNYKHSNLQPKTISVDRNANNVLCPVTAMLNYLKVMKHQSGPLFQLHSPLIDPDDVEESVLVKNAIQQAKKYQEQLKKLGKQDN
jgi:hypothetical protein